MPEAIDKIPKSIAAGRARELETTNELSRRLEALTQRWVPYDPGVIALITLFSVFTWLVIAKLAVLLIDLQLDRASFDGLPRFLLVWFWRAPWMPGLQSLLLQWFGWFHDRRCLQLGC